TAADLKLQRPATGIRGRHKDMVTGAVLREDVKAGTALNWKSIEF
ncbi:MAG: SAF domain-containing protein, partial [Bdellovibrionota bacterium]